MAFSRSNGDRDMVRQWSNCLWYRKYAWASCGKDYPVTGDPRTDTRSHKKVNDHTLAFTNKKDDKVTISGHGVVSADIPSRFFRSDLVQNHQASSSDDNFGFADHSFRIPWGLTPGPILRVYGVLARHSKM